MAYLGTRHFCLLVLLCNFVMHCIISTVVVAFEIKLSYLILAELLVVMTDGLKMSEFVLEMCPAYTDTSAYKRRCVSRISLSFHAGKQFDC